MTPAPRRRLLARLGLVALLAVAATVAVVAWRHADDDAPGRADAAGTVAADGLLAVGPSAQVPLPQDPERWLGPQGRTGQFVVGCAYSHSASDDPIVHPGHAGRSHRHDFYGASTTAASSSIADLRRGTTTCDKSVDTAGYWQPTLYDAGEVVVPRGLDAYYRAAPGVDRAAVQTMPEGLALIAGDMTATSPQPGEATGWTCGTRTTLSDLPPTCTPSAPLHLVLTFPDCWDGVHLDSADHHSHAAYSADGACPAGFAVPIPQITVSISFPIWGAGHDLSLASGPITSAHGDFWNAWDPAGLQREIDGCIHRGAVCDLASNRDEEALFSGG